jgi:hypothetical protein
MNAVNSTIKIVKALTAMPSDASAGALVGDIISLKNWGHCDIVIRAGATVDSDVAVTVQKGSSVSSAATSLAFSRYLSQGKILHITGASGVFTVGETVTGGSSSTTGVVYKDRGENLVLYSPLVSTPAFTAGETITGGTSGVTATAVATVSGGTYADDECDALVPRTATSDTFNILGTTEVEALYVIPIDASMLGDGYDCIELNVADSGGGSNCYLDALYILSEPRYMDELGGPSAIIN